MIQLYSYNLITHMSKNNYKICTIQPSPKNKTHVIEKGDEFAYFLLKAYNPIWASKTSF